MKPIFLGHILGGLFLFASHSSAQAAARQIQLSQTTDRGCLLFVTVDDTPRQREIAGRQTVSWSESCENGRLVNGVGILTIHLNEEHYAISRWEQSGRMVDGVFDGQVHTTGIGVIGTEDYGTETYRMGCRPGPPCVAHKRLSSAVSNRISGGGAAVPALRPTITQEDHNPAGEAADCIRVIYAEDFEVEHVSSTQKAAFRNRCSRPVEVTWCTVSGDCRPGYSNLATVSARKDRGFSYEPSVVGSKVAYAACYNGFVQHQGDLSKKLLHACK
jgi:hypothetical protein